jgi:hypothetical protein
LKICDRSWRFGNPTLAKFTYSQAATPDIIGGTLPATRQRVF